MDCKAAPIATGSLTPLTLQSFQLFLISMRIGLVMEHPDQLVLLIHIPDVNAVANGFVGEMSVVSFSHFYGHIGRLLTLQAATICRRPLYRFA
jgi:hypothetical protein